MKLASTNNLTEGTPWRLMVAFAFPLFVSQIFQQLYNTADCFIVGKFLGTSALAAVTSANNMVYLYTSFFTGLATGAGVVIARYFGSKDYCLVGKSVHTNILFGILSGLVLSLVGYFTTPWVLRIMHVDSQFYALAVSYYKVYFAGSLAVVMYNLCLGIMNALGDSKRPLFYLIFSSVLNVILDVLFVGVFDMGVSSAALATVISQFVSVALCIIHLCKKGEVYTLSLSKLKLDMPILGEMVRYGLPSGVTNCVIGLANVIVQSSINSFGMIATAAFGIHTKIEGFGFLPITSFTMAISTFVSQNLGAGEYDRAKKGARFGILTSIIIAELIGVVLFVSSEFLMGLFDSNPEVVALGAKSERIMCLFYFLLAFSHAIASVFRGAGKPVVPMVIMLSVWCVFRICYITFVMNVFNRIEFVFWAYPLTWSISSVIYLIYYIKSDWVHGFEKDSID